MIHKSLVILIIVLSLFSCRESDPPIRTELKIIRIAGQHEIMDFTYEEGLPVEIRVDGVNFDYRDEFIYEQGLLLTYSRYLQNSNKIFDESFVYHERGDILSSYQESGKDHNWKYYYDMHTEHSIVKNDVVCNKFGDQHLHITIYEYENDNLVYQKEMTNDSSFISESFYEYDSFISPVSTIKDQLFPASTSFVYSKNNIVKIETFYKSDHSIGSVTTFDYTYDQNGIPQTYVRKVDGQEMDSGTYTFGQIEKAESKRPPF